MKKECIRFCFQGNSLRQKNLGSIVVTWCFLMFGSSLQTRWRKTINKPSKKKMQHLHCSMMTIVKFYILQNRDNQIQSIQYENVALQAQRDVYQTQLQKCQDTIIHLKTRCVPHARDPGKNKNIIIVLKHATPAGDKFHNLAFYVARIQWRKRYVKLRWFDQHFPDHEVIVEIDNPNSIHAFNRFEEEGHAEWKYNHLRSKDLTREELHVMWVPSLMMRRNKKFLWS